MFKLLNNLEMFTDFVIDNSSPSSNSGKNDNSKDEQNNVKMYIQGIFGIIILIASISMAIYRIKKHADFNKGEYENTLYILGVILISICCNMCYLPYAIVYSFVFKTF